MQMDGDKIKVELYREHYKKVTGQTDAQFDHVVAAYPNAKDALAYLKSQVGER